MRDSCSPASSVASRLSAETLQTTVQHRRAPTITQLDRSAPLTFDEKQLAYACPFLVAVAQPLMSAEEEAAAEQFEAQFRAELARHFPQRNYITQPQTLQGPGPTQAVTSAQVCTSASAPATSNTTSNTTSTVVLQTAVETTTAAPPMHTAVS